VVRVGAEAGTRMSIAYQLRSSLDQGYQRGKPVRSPPYLAFIRKQASVVSGLGPCQACHTGPHGASQKSSDLSAIPLTWDEHLEYGKAPYTYAKAHGLKVRKLILKLNAEFQADGGIY